MTVYGSACDFSQTDPLSLCFVEDAAVGLVLV